MIDTLIETLYRYGKRYITLPIAYVLALSLATASFLLTKSIYSGLRGGLFSNFLFYLFSGTISLLVLIWIFRSRHSRLTKFALALPQILHHFQ